LNSYKTVETPRERGLLSLETKISPLYTSIRGIVVGSSPNYRKSSLVASNMEAPVSVIVVATWARPSASPSCGKEVAHDMRDTPKTADVTGAAVAAGADDAADAADMAGASSVIADVSAANVHGALVGVAQARACSVAAAKQEVK
jgi:hypothetical protein